MSIYTSPIINGINKFLQLVRFEDDSLIYSSNNSSNIFDVWKTKYSINKEYVIVHGIQRPNRVFKKKLKVVPLSQIPRVEKYILNSMKVLEVLNHKNDLLANYFESHIITESSYDRQCYSYKQKYEKVLTGEAQRNEWKFLKHGSYLLSLLLRASGELTLPYSSRYPNAQPIHGLVQLQKKIELADKELKTKSIVKNWERFLMKYETERIYHLSYLAEVSNMIAHTKTKEVSQLVGYVLTEISKRLLSLDSQVLNNYYIRKIKGAKLSQTINLDFEQELFVTQSITLPFLKKVFFYWLYRISKCKALLHIDADVREQQVIDYIFFDSCVTDTEHKKWRAEYNRLFNLCRKYIEANYQTNPMDCYTGTAFGDIRMPHKAYELNLTGLLNKQYHLPTFWLNSIGLSAEYLNALAQNDNKKLEQIKISIRENIKYHENKDVTLFTINSFTFPFTNLYIDYQREYEQ